jgi:tetratricopeptide (TPR) repeat protein
LCLASLASVACQRSGAGSGEAGAGANGGALEQGRALLEQGELDAALAKFKEAQGDPESFYYQGLVWVKKAETAPLPTPPPPPSPLPRGYVPAPRPEFKPEELQAIGSFENAVAARPDNFRAHLALAELLAPHALRRHDQEQEEALSRRTRRGQGAPEPAAASGTDSSADRVVREYRAAAEDERAPADAAEALLRFALRVGRLDAAEAAHLELIRRNKESGEPLARYGDFLLNDKKEREAAIAQYRQALMWSADDEATKAKIADIYIAMATEHFAQEQYAMADAKFKEAEKWISDRSSPRGRRVQEHLKRLREIRW